MRTFLKVKILLLFVIVNQLLIFSQTEPIEVVKSTEKIIIDNNVYYVHVVKRGETLYSISRAYGVSLMDITKENPDVMYGLMVGHVLKIPEIKEEEISEEDKANFIFHKVKKGQTLYSLMKKYNVDTSIVFKYNPGVRDGLKFDMVLKIPKIKPGESQEDNDYTYYKVKKKETLYSLSKKFNVSIRAIKDANEELKHNQLKYGQYIRIPKSDSILTGFLREYSMYIDTSQIDYDSIIYYDAKDYNCDLNALIYSKDTVNVALLIPCYLPENLSMNRTDTNNTDLNKYYNNYDQHNDFRIYRKTYKFLEFYEGLLLAVDTLRRNGISVKLNIFSVENDTNDIKLIVESIQNKHIDLIIGPVYTRAVKKIVELVRDSSTYIVLPFVTDNKLLVNNPNVFMIRPSENNQFNMLADLLSYYHENNIILINSDSFIDSLKLSSFKSKLYKKISEKTDLERVFVREIEYNDTVQKALEHSLSKTMKNVVYINSTKAAFVSEIITKLNGLRLFYDIELIGLPRWKWYENLDVEYYYNLNLKYFTPFYVDYQDDGLKRFLMKFHCIYHTEPSEYSYSFSGYDIMFYFGTALHLYGQAFPFCLSSLDIDLLESEYKFYRINGTSGFENMSERMFHYKPGLTLLNYDSINGFVSNTLYFQHY